MSKIRNDVTAQVTQFNMRKAVGKWPDKIQDLFKSKIQLMKSKCKLLSYIFNKVISNQNNNSEQQS